MRTSFSLLCGIIIILLYEVDIPGFDQNVLTARDVNAGYTTGTIFLINIGCIWVTLDPV